LGGGCHGCLPATEGLCFDHPKGKLRAEILATAPVLYLVRDAREEGRCTIS